VGLWNPTLRKVREGWATLAENVHGG
jgi:hypothetical protein